MSSSVTIKEADLNNKEDARNVLTLLNHYANDIMGGGNDLSEYVQKNLIAELCKRRSTVVILVYLGSEPVGLTIAFEGFSTFYAKPLINIHDFVVIESHRGKGIAKLMLNKIEEIALTRGCCKLTLEVLEGNKRAQKVYKDFGFEGYQLDPKMGKAIFLDKKLL